MTRNVRSEALDVLEVDGESLVLLRDGQMVRLSPLATAVFRLTAAPTTVEAIAAVLEETFGAPEAGTTVDATRSLVAEMLTAGLLRPAPDGGPASKGRVRNWVTCSSKSLAICETWDFDNPVIPRVWTRVFIRLVDTPSR